MRLRWAWLGQRLFNRRGRGSGGSHGLRRVAGSIDAAHCQKERTPRTGRRCGQKEGTEGCAGREGGGGDAGWRRMREGSGRLASSSRKGVLSAVCCTLRPFVTPPRLRVRPLRPALPLSASSLAALSSTAMAPKYWLMKAEPDSRVVKGKDVKVRSHGVAICARVRTKRASSASTTSRPSRPRLGKGCATRRLGT